MSVRAAGPEPFAVGALHGEGACGEEAAGALHLLSPNMMLNSALAELGSLVLAADTAHCLFGCCAYLRTSNF